VVALVAAFVACAFILSLWPIARKVGLHEALPHSAVLGATLCGAIIWAFHPWYWHRRLASTIIFAWLGFSTLSGFSCEIRDFGQIQVPSPNALMNITAPALAFFIWRYGEQDLLNHKLRCAIRGNMKLKRSRKK
jgi:hypothetical protein